jgi:polysaccharide chain length determinant protein (PEP-CTERM system associated)
MIENRELNIDDYLAMLRRRVKVILIPVLLAPLVGFLISYAFAPKYTSQALILVEGQKVPEGYVKPVVTEDLTQRVATMVQQVLSRDRLQPMIERTGLAKSGASIDEVVDKIRENLFIEPVVTDLNAIAGGRRRKITSSPDHKGDVPGFYVDFTAPNARQAQQVCSELTSMLLQENLKSREQVAQSTTDFLRRQLEEAKRNLDEQDSKLAVFKRQYMGQLPGDADNNAKLLMTLNSDLDATTQAVNRAQQDKAYTESLLAQQLAAWNSTQTSSNPATLEKQLSDLQSQLLQLQSHYTSDHPDVIKTKADIAELKKKLAEIDASSAEGADQAETKTSASEPPEIRQLRMQVHQYQEAVAQATREQKRLQEQIRIYQGRMALSPGVEEQYKQLTRDYDTAQKIYQELLTKKSASEMATDMERRQQGEQMRLLDAANLPEDPSFPDRLKFSLGGLATGMVMGLGLALWLEMRDKAIRTEQDVEAALELPMLVSMPWVGMVATNGNGNRSWSRSKAGAKDKTENEKETVKV